ncbi:hypothetical protein M0R45_000076 [Rubus argutus]|uniref:Vesicle-fusing ATPase n=1 Tax=Rubus argutus TaxID=59490 RepID=A0AAW1VQ98_RUBAR
MACRFGFSSLFHQVKRNRPFLAFDRIKRWSSSSSSSSSTVFRQRIFDLEKHGIGGLSVEFADLFRSAFATRLFPPDMTDKLGFKHVKGVLLHGPPGTGKTLMASQVGKILDGIEPKFFNAYDLLEESVTVIDLFKDAELKPWSSKKDDSQLHVIILDEIDALYKQRGLTEQIASRIKQSGDDDSKFREQICDGHVLCVRFKRTVSRQLLEKMDAVKPLNNILIIGTTNRKDLIDLELLRPGRFDVQIEISLPDENSRLQILRIHTKNLKRNSFLGRDVSLSELAARTQNYSGAELEAVVNSAVSCALNKLISLHDVEDTERLQENSVKVTRNDFLNAIRKIVPASVDVVESLRPNGMVQGSDQYQEPLHAEAIYPRKKKKNFTRSWIFLLRFVSEKVVIEVLQL